MSKPFLKFYMSQEWEHLKKLVNPCHLFDYLAKKTQEVNKNSILNYNECFITGYQETGLKSEKTYRHAKKVLENLGHIEIVQVYPRNRKRGPGAASGTHIRIISSTIYEIHDFSRGGEGAARGAARIHSEIEELGAARGADKETFSLNASRLKDERVCGNVHNSQNILNITAFINASNEHYAQTSSSFAQAQEDSFASPNQESSELTSDIVCKGSNSQDHLSLVNNFRFRNGHLIQQHVLKRWKETYPIEDIAAGLSYYQEQSGKKLIHTPEAYMENCLKLEYWNVNQKRIIAKLADETHKDKLKYYGA